MQAFIISRINSFFVTSLRLDEVDITELEAFRKDLSQQRSIKMTLLAFVLKGCVSALAEFPNFNASLDSHVGSVKYCLTNYLR